MHACMQFLHAVMHVHMYVCTCVCVAVMVAVNLVNPCRHIESIMQVRVWILNIICMYLRVAYMCLYVNVCICNITPI